MLLFCSFILSSVLYYYFGIKKKNQFMQPEPQSLFSYSALPEQTTFHGKWQALKKTSQPLPLYLLLYENGFCEYSTNGSFLSSVHFDFDLKLACNLESLSLTFQRGNETCTYEFGSEEEVRKWREILRMKINQRGFHQQFKAIDKIGKGSFATVYLVKKKQNKQFYAVKAFSKEAAYSEENGKQCVMKEIQLMRKFNHPNLLKLEEVFETENSLYIVFQFLSGGQLFDKVKEKYKFKPEQTKNIIYGILNGLAEMHSHNIMHRDLKPENLLFRKKGNYDCVIADFGLSEYADAEQYLFVRCGTPGYVAPEVINIKDLKTKYNPICDIYSLGLIFYLLLLGKSAFPGKNYDDVLTQNRAADVSIGNEEKKKIDPQALDLLLKMLTKSPKDRITAEQALNHPYFSEHRISENDQMMDEQKNETNADRVDSPLLTTANRQRRLNRKIKKDSCLSFKMGKENIITGKSDPVGNIGSNKTSFMNSRSQVSQAKHSRFKHT